MNVGNVSIGWINSTSAYVGLYRREQAAVALSTLSQSDTYSIMTYSKRQAQLLGLKTIPMSPVPKAKRALETPMATNSKKRKTSSLSKRSIEPIEEEPEEIATPVKAEKQERKSPILKTSSKKRKQNKTFQEDNSWD